MSDHPSIDVFENYRRRRLGPAELLEFDDHVATCSACRELLRDMMPSRAAALKLRASLQVEDLPAKTSTWASIEAAIRSLWSSIFALSAPLQAAGAIVLVVVLTLGIAILLRNPDRSGVAVQRPPVSQPPSQPAIMLALNDGGGRVTLDAEGNVEGIGSLAAADQQRIRTALIAQSVAVPAAARELQASPPPSLGGERGGPRTGAGSRDPYPPPEFAVHSPVGIIVATNRPTLRWGALSGATVYQVTITDPEAGYQEVAASPELQETMWTVDKPLARGRIYTWHVSAQTPSGEVKAPYPAGPEAKFKVLERDKADELANARKSYAGRHLVLGVLYAEAGLLNEAEAEFQALLKANPQSEVARKLLQALRAGNF